MYLQLLSNLISQYPDESHAIRKIDSLYSRKGTEYHFDGLYSVVAPRSSYALANILNQLVETGFIHKTFRVISPVDAGGLGEYSNIFDLPDEIEDFRGGGEMLLVTPQNVKVYYKSKAS